MRPCNICGERTATRVSSSGRRWRLWPTRSRRLDDAVTLLLRSHDFSGVARLYEKAGRNEAAATAWRRSADSGNRCALDDAVRRLEQEGRADRARQLRRYGWNQDGTLAEPWTCPDATALFDGAEPLSAL